MKGPFDVGPKTSKSKVKKDNSAQLTSFQTFLERFGKGKQVPSGPDYGEEAEEKDLDEVFDMEEDDEEDSGDLGTGLGEYM